MLVLRLETHQVDDVDHPYLQIREVPPQQIDGRERLERRDVTAAGHDDIGLVAAVVRGPLPDADPGGAVLDRRFHVQVLEGGLLAGDDHVHAIAAFEALLRHPEQRVRVGREVDADDLGLLVHDVVEEARILVGEAVVVLAPDVELRR